MNGSLFKPLWGAVAHFFYKVIMNVCLLRKEAEECRLFRVLVVPIKSFARGDR